MKIEIEGSLPTLNQYVNAERTNRFIAAKIKKTATERVAYRVRGAEKITTLADFTFTWYVPNKRSDPDNIAFAAKFVMDGLVQAEVLPNDSMRYVRSICHFYEIGTPKVVVEIEES